MASKLETMEKKIESILKNREDELTALRNEVIADRQRVEAANKQLDEAIAANDIEKYRAAKAEKELAADQSNLHEARSKQLLDEELVSEEEYLADRDAVLDEVNAILAANNKKAASLLAQLEIVAANDSAIITRANNALLRWQAEIFRDPDLRRRDGAIIEPRLVRCAITPVVTLSEQIRGRTDYQQVTGRRD